MTDLPKANTTYRTRSLFELLVMRALIVSGIVGTIGCVAICLFLIGFDDSRTVSGARDIDKTMGSLGICLRTFFWSLLLCGMGIVVDRATSPPVTK